MRYGAQLPLTDEAAEQALVFALAGEVEQHRVDAHRLKRPDKVFCAQLWQQYVLPVRQQSEFGELTQLEPKAVVADVTE